MAQIKNIKKPGDLIRGAKVGVAGLDKDGNVIGTGIDAGDITTFPEGAQIGDVLTWGGETGPEWDPPSGGGDKLYAHNINGARNDYAVIWFQIITRSSAQMTVSDIISFLSSNNINFEGRAIPATGFLLTRFQNELTYINGVYALDNQLYATYFNVPTADIVNGSITRQANRGGSAITIRDQDIVDVVYEI